MSETDDTDVLLLIPPNFFLVQSSGSDDSLLDSSRTVVHKPVSCTAQVLGKLVTQVHSLESRLESLELSDSSSISKRKHWDTTDSIGNQSLDRKCFTFPRRRRRKISKREKRRELSLTSLDSCSTLQQVPHLKLDTKRSKDLYDTPSMDGDISSIVSTPSKKNDKLLLHEIDEFLTKVDAYESPDTKFKDQESTLTPESVIRATGDYLTHKLDCKDDDIKLPSGRVVSSKILDKYIYLVKSNTGSTSSDKPNTQSHENENSCTLHKDSSSRILHKDSKLDQTKSPIRRLNFAEDKDVQPTSTPKRPVQSSSYLDTFRPSSNKIYDRASKVLEHYKSQNYSHSRNTHNTLTDSYLSPKKDDFKMPQMRPYVTENKDLKAALQNKLIETIDTDLLSLSELWGEKGDRTERGDNLKLEEERLKREHCEAMIQQLQKKILDQQEKLAVALKVDRAKDAAITKLREAWLKITGNLDKTEERHRAALEKMMREMDNSKAVAGEAQKKTSHYEAELYKALDLAHDYQEKCKQLTADHKELQDKMDTSLASKQDIICSKEKEIEVLKENYEIIMRLNKQSTDCIKNLEESLQKEKSEHESTKNKVCELNRKVQTIYEETSLTTQERDLLKEKVNEERAKANILERHLSEKQNENSEMQKKCDALDNEVKTLRKLLELQKNELKVHYQKQLEDAVLAKLQEFQQQLDLAEREMEDNARCKENALVDTYNKQIARIEEQHKLEVNVLEEKQKEEIKLYRLQLAQASERMSLLESKLESFRRRRGQIASQLHGVMESQWRQALLILTNGGPGSSLDLTRTDSVATPVAPEYAPPLTSSHFGDHKPLRQDERRDRLFNFEGLSDNELQQYVKLLLTKPVAMERSAEEPTSDRADAQMAQDARKARRSGGGKPPWKA